MNVLASMPASGIIVIATIAILFVLAVLLLFYTWGRYKGLAGMVKGGLDRDNGFLRFTVNDFADAYKKYGQDVNTPAIISNAVSTKLSGLLLCERFLANAVSLFVTLGLFGTFLGLSHSVSSLTELISYSNTSEWLSVLDSVGGGLMSRPKVLMMDEPSLGLAPLVVQGIFDIIREINRQGVTILLIEQNANMALKIADLAYVLETGTITMSGTGAELLADEKVKEAYLGKKRGK